MNRFEIVYYGAPAWCVPCQRFEPHWNQAVEDADGAYDFRMVDVDLVDPQMLVDAKIQSVPTVVVYMNGKEVGRCRSRTTEKLLIEIDGIVWNQTKD